jgi:hypothetical protein
VQREAIAPRPAGPAEADDHTRVEDLLRADVAALFEDGTGRAQLPLAGIVEATSASGLGAPEFRRNRHPAPGERRERRRVSVGALALPGCGSAHHLTLAESFPI